MSEILLQQMELLYLTGNASNVILVSAKVELTSNHVLRVSILGKMLQVKHIANTIRLAMLVDLFRLMELLCLIGSASCVRQARVRVL